MLCEHTNKHKQKLQRCVAQPIVVEHISLRWVFGARCVLQSMQYVLVCLMKTNDILLSPDKCNRISIGFRTNFETVFLIQPPIWLKVDALFSLLSASTFCCYCNCSLFGLACRQRDYVDSISMPHSRSLVHSEMHWSEHRILDLRRIIIIIMEQKELFVSTFTAFLSSLIYCCGCYFTQMQTTMGLRNSQPTNPEFAQCMERKKDK